MIMALILIVSLMSCSPETTPEINCIVTIEVINTLTGEHIPVSKENYNMLYDLYMDLNNSCNDAIIDYGYHTIIYTSIKEIN